MKQVDVGIFLHRTPYSSSSLVTTFYTRSGGLKKFIFKGGKKKAHQLYPLSLSEITYYGRPGSELLNLTEANPVTSHDFQFDPVKSTIAFFLAEAIRKCVIEGDSDNATFDFLFHEIELLNSQDEYALLPIRFLSRFTELLGIQPLVELSGTIFDLDEGVISKNGDKGHRLSEGDHIQLIASLVQGNSYFGDTSRSIREDALETLMDYYKIHVPRLKSFDTYEIVREILSE
jgi:DNA repair protein RecO (recombination protein O)